MTPFADSSALVKLYADEPHAQVVRRHSLLVVSAVARVEVPAALWRKSRMADLAVEDAAVLVQAFEVDWTDPARRLLAIRLRPPVLADAARLTGTHGLRAYAAIQLASARAARAADPVVDAFLSSTTSSGRPLRGRALPCEIRSTIMRSHAEGRLAGTPLPARLRPRLPSPTSPRGPPRRDRMRTTAHGSRP